MTMTYTKLLKRQNLPQIANFFGISPENFQARLNNSESIESKLMAAFMMVVVSKQRAEKLAAEVSALIRRAEEDIENYINHRRSTMSHASAFVDKAEKHEGSNATTSTSVLAELMTFVKSIELQREALVKQHKIQVQQLHDVYVEAAEGVVTKDFGINVEPSKVGEMWDSLQARRDDKEQRLDAIEKVVSMLPPPAPPAPKLGRFETKGLQAEQEQREIARERADINDDLRTQIILAGKLLRRGVEDGPIVEPIKVAAPASGAILQLEKDHNNKLTALNKVFEATHATLTNVMDRVNDRIDAFKQWLTNPLSAPAPAPALAAKREEQEEVFKKKPGPRPV
jgi:hypothetical protein